MNLKLLLTAALSTAALAAHADVQLYGSIKSGIETSQTRFGGQSYSRTAVADQGSHIGLRGSHPIGGGTNFYLGSRTRHTGRQKRLHPPRLARTSRQFWPLKERLDSKGRLKDFQTACFLF